MGINQQGDNFLFTPEQARILGLDFDDSWPYVERSVSEAPALYELAQAVSDMGDEAALVGVHGIERIRVAQRQHAAALAQCLARELLSHIPLDHPVATRDLG